MARLAPAQVVEGRNFFFGCRRRGDVELLRREGPRKGFALRVVEPVNVDLGGGARRVSSTLIRALLREGRVADANRCLGWEFTLHGRVVGGYRRGRLLSYPTANIEAGQQVTPADGIYAARAAVAGTTCPAAVSIGGNPTFGPGERAIEAHLLNTEGDFYDESMSLAFVSRLRAQERFPDAESLKAQIARDIERVRAVCE